MINELATLCLLQFMKKFNKIKTNFKKIFKLFSFKYFNKHLKIKILNKNYFLVIYYLFIKSKLNKIRILDAF